MLEINDENFETEITTSELPALVDFWAPWCGPCNMVGPIIEQLAVAYDGKLKVAKMNVDVSAGTANRFGVRGIPTVILFKGGKEVDKIVGAVPKAKFEAMLQKHL